MQKRRSYSDRLRISIDGGESCFYTLCGTNIANGYERVVIGKRGPYIEFVDSQIVQSDIHVPDSKKYKIDNNYVYYHEYRSDDKSGVKLYYQRMTVMYADYKVGYWYISPFDVVTKDGDVMGPLYDDIDKHVPEKNGGSLWDVV